MSLADSPPDPPYPKLPFWDTVSLSYSTYFSQFIDVLRASWLWLLVVAAFTGFASWQQWSWLARAMENLFTGVQRFCRERDLGVLKKARLSKAFQDELIDAGYPKDFAKDITMALAKHLTQI